MTTPQPIPQALRALHAARVHHFTPFDPSGQPRAPAFAIVATEERLGVLLDAASELEAQQRAEDRKTVERLQGWIEQQEVAANGWSDNPATVLADLGAPPELVEAARLVCDEPVAVVAHDQVREAALAELATWDQGAPGGPTAYEVAHSICRRLGVVL